MLLTMFRRVVQLILFMVTKLLHTFYFLSRFLVQIIMDLTYVAEKNASFHMVLIIYGPIALKMHERPLTPLLVFALNVIKPHIGKNRVVFLIF